VRGLFVQHTRTGNPLVDSVAEHQPATTDAYFRYLQNMFYWYPVGLILLCFKRTDSKLFAVVYGCVAYYFSSKMSRLVLLMGPVTSVLASSSIATVGHWSYHEPKKTRLKKVSVVLLLSTMIVSGVQFVRYSFEMAPHLSNPSIMFQSTLTNGQDVIVDDYREAYTWLRDKTPQDARVMAWWDYGYQINGIAERTTIADGNTWNHEHIATLGRCLVSPEQQAHAMVKHLADYVLIWSGSGGDLGKSPHMARIGNSVYNDICPGDITCSAFGFSNGRPTKMMAESLLYKLETGLQNTTLFQHVYDSKYRLVRIYRVLDIDKESKKWGETNNEYSPALLDIISVKQNFHQLED
jgi:dolichyl-diphosphooligosaccharide--protein glycosyltransferase